MVIVRATSTEVALLFCLRPRVSYIMRLNSSDKAEESEFI